MGPLPPSHGFTHILTAVDVFSRYMIAIPLRRPDAPSVVNGLMSIITRHAYVLNTILSDKGSAFTAEVVQRTMQQARIQIKHATVKHAHTIGKIERSHQEIKKILEINVSVDQPQWDQYVNIAVVAHNTT